MRAVSDLWCSLECTPACQAGGRGFKSRQVRQPGSWGRHSTSLVAHGRVAQLAERAPEKREVTGSMPVPTTAELAARGHGDPTCRDAEKDRRSSCPRESRLCQFSRRLRSHR